MCSHGGVYGAAVDEAWRSHSTWEGNIRSDSEASDLSLRTNSSLQRGEQGVLVTAAFTKDTALRGLITAGF